jgi:hypothetical protein
MSPIAGRRGLETTHAAALRPGTAAADPLPPIVAAALAPVRAWALGVAVGLVFAAALTAVTAAHLLVLPREAPHLDLLGQYFAGYGVSPAGAAIGALWSFLVGFAAGALIAVVRNSAVRLWIAFVRARANLWESEFLDGI